MPKRSAPGALLLALVLGIVLLAAVATASADAGSAARNAARPAAALVAPRPVVASNAEPLGPFGLVALVVASFVPAVVLMSRHRRPRTLGGG